MKHVYFLRPIGATSPVKIGCSATPVKRLRSVEIWSPVELELVASAPGNNCHEWTLHQMFATDRLHGEWFAESERLNEVINQVAATGALPPLPVPNGPKEWSEARAKAKATRPRRAPAEHLAKSKLTSRITAAEKHAFGFGDKEYRPAEICEIVASYQGFGSPLPSDDALALCEEYIGRLLKMPKSDRSFAAWKKWSDARAAGQPLPALDDAA